MRTQGTLCGVPCVPQKPVNLHFPGGMKDTDLSVGFEKGAQCERGFNEPLLAQAPHWRRVTAETVYVSWVPNRHNQSPTDEMAPSPPGFVSWGPVLSVGDRVCRLGTQLTKIFRTQNNRSFAVSKSEFSSKTERFSFFFGPWCTL